MWRNISKASFFLACKFFVCSFQANCQQEQVTRFQAVSLEIGKTGLIYNVTYDKRIKKSKAGLRAGLGSNFGSGINLFTIGGGGYLLVGEDKNFLELGTDLHYIRVSEPANDQLGVADVFIYPDRQGNYSYWSVNIGHRHHGKTFLFRTGLSAGLLNFKLIPGGYLSFGFLF